MPEFSLIYRTDAWILILILFVLMMLSIYLGRKIGLARMPADSLSGPTGTIISALFGLLAFLLAFTFSMSASRYDTRRKNIVEEANAIGTAILRADLYPQEQREAFRAVFKEYLEARIKYFESGSDLPKALEAKMKSDEFGKKLWNLATDQQSKNIELLAATQEMVPALNNMLDAETTRLIGELSRVPDSIVIMLLALSVASAFYLGYSSASKGHLDWLVAFGFCLLISLVIFITLDLDRPRRGLIQLDTSHKAMMSLRELFNGK